MPPDGGEHLLEVGEPVTGARRSPVQLAPAVRRHGQAVPQARLDDRVVAAHEHAVRAEPDIDLDAVGAALEGGLDRGNRVLGALRAGGAAVAENERAPLAWDGQREGGACVHGRGPFCGGGRLFSSPPTVPEAPGPG